MQFEEARKKQAELAGQLRQGTLTPARYAEAANQMQVRDDSGAWWQPSPDGNGWLRYSGTQWVAATPPSPVKVNSPPPPDAPARAKDFTEFKSSLMSVEEFKKVSKDVPLAKRPQPWWDLLSILGGVVSAVFWLLYSGIREGFDIFTPILMIGIPVILVWFRADIDQMLRPIQPFRQKIPTLLLIGVGIAFPFLTSFVLYSIGIKEYLLIQSNMLIGTLGAYAITRTPVIAAGSGGKPQGRPLPAGGFLALVIAAVCAFLVLPVRADDCTRDILNANDCLRTDGYAEVISGGFSTLVSILINGPTIIQTLITVGPGIQPPLPPAQPPAPQTPPQQQTPPEPPYVETPEEKAAREEALRQMKAEKERLLALEAARNKAQEEARQKMLNNLDTMQDGMVKRREFTVEDYDRISKQIEKVRSQLKGKGDVDVDLYSKIYNVYKGRVQGRTIPESQIPSEAQLFRETIQQTVETSSREIFTGVDAEGNFSKKAFALRMVIGGATGFSSELVYTPASATYTMKDYVDKGGNSILGAFGTAMKEVVIGELMGRGIGGALKFGGKGISLLANKFLPKTTINALTSSITSVKDGFAKIKTVLNTEIRNPFAGTKSGVSTFRTPPKTTGQILDDIKRAKATSQPSPGLKDVSFTPAADSTPNLSGMTDRQRKYAQMVFDKHGVNGVMRPTTSGAGAQVENGLAHAKPEPIKAKSVSDEDVLLGFDPKSKTAAGCKKPTLPSQESAGLNDEQYASLKNRYQKRMDDFHDNAPGLEDLENQGKIKWDRETGKITDAETGMQFVTDHDPMAYVDATTGKPVSPFTVNQINKELQAGGVTMHNEHVNWDYTHYSQTPAAGQQHSPFQKAFNNDTNILNGHTQGTPGAKPLNMYNSLTGKWESVWWNGGTRKF